MTALVVLVVDGRIVYAFASNSRKRPNLIKTKDDLTSVLNMLKTNLEAKTKESDQLLFDRLLRQILRLNTVRVQAYLTHLTKDLAACVKACEGDVSDETQTQEGVSSVCSLLLRCINVLWQSKAAAKSSRSCMT